MEQAYGLGKTVPVATAVLLAVIMLVMGIHVITQVPGSSSTNSTLANDVTDTSVDLNTSTGYTLSVTSELVPASVTAVNSSDDDITSDITANYTSGLITTTVNWTDANVSFQYYTYPIVTTTLSNASQSGITGLTTLVNWMPVLMVVFAAVLLLGILMMAFNRKSD